MFFAADRLHFWKSVCFMSLTLECIYSVIQRCLCSIYIKLNMYSSSEQHQFCINSCTRWNLISAKPRKPVVVVCLKENPVETYRCCICSPVLTSVCVLEKDSVYSVYFLSEIKFLVTLVDLTSNALASFFPLIWNQK